jgi:hypothetical protein
MSANPNNCSACDYKRMNDDPTLHCYMWKDAPADVCHQHTGRKDLGFALLMAVAKFGSLSIDAKEPTTGAGGEG